MMNKMTILHLVKDKDGHEGESSASGVSGDNVSSALARPPVSIVSVGAEAVTSVH
jgi:hypothetical protein